jgi:hypothetical protein
MNIRDKLQGQQAVSALALSIYPLIESHFKQFDGKRIILKSGNTSAKFKSQADKFISALSLSDNEHVHIDATEFSVTIRSRVRLKSSYSNSTDTFDAGFYIGDVTRDIYDDKASGLFKYEGVSAATIDVYNTVIKLTIKSIESKRAKYHALKTKAEAIRNSVPYSMRDLIVKL